MPSRSGPGFFVKISIFFSAAPQGVRKRPRRRAGALQGQTISILRLEVLLARIMAGLSLVSSKTSISGGM